MEAQAQTNSTISRQDARGMDLKARMDSAIARLAQQLAEGHSDAYKQFLAFYSRFWTYSVRNTVLIHEQCPQATRCAGLKLWNRLGYHVRPGQHAIWIWAPILKKEIDDDSGDEVEVVAGFVPAPVFDASQLMEIAERPLLSPYPVLPDDAGEGYALCVAKIRQQGIAVEETTNLPHRVMGASRPSMILIDPRQDSRNRLFTLVHELVHQVWHHGLRDPATPRQQLEFEAESTAFVIAAILGLDHPSARDYLISYQVTPVQLKRSLAVIQLEVRHVLRLLELPFEVLGQPEAMAA